MIATPPELDVPGLPISVVSRILGVPMPTLRSWELRYHLPASTRGAGTHRRYTPADLHCLRLMRDEIARGKSAGDAARSVQQLLASTGRPADFVAAVLRESERGDPAALRDRLTDAQVALGLGPCLDDVLLPAMQQIGLWWATGRCDIDQEHLSIEAARGWLETLNAFAPHPVRPNPIVLACGPTDLHTIGLEALAVLLRYDGRACRMLGARTSAAALLTAVLAGAADAAVIVSHLSTGRRRSIEAIRAVDKTATPVFYAGNAFTSLRSRRDVPGSYLGTRLEGACAMIAVELDSPHTGSSAPAAG